MLNTYTLIDSTSDFAAALASERLLPGDTLLLRGGVYRGQFVASLCGTPDAPIRVLPFEQERVTIEGGLWIQGSDTHWHGLDIHGDWNAYPRSTTENINELRIDGVRTRLANCVIHDVSQVGFWMPAIDAELHGCLFYNCGTSGTRARLRHTLYAQNEAGVKRITNCIFLPGFSEYGIHAYAENGVVNGFVFDGVVHVGKRWQIGGKVPFDNIEIRSSYTYKTDLRLGYNLIAENGSVLLEGNNFGGFLQLLNVGKWKMKQNIFHAMSERSNRTILSANWNDTIQHEELIDENIYHIPALTGTSFSVQGTGHTFRKWQERGYDKRGFYRYGSNGIDGVYIQPDRYNDERAQIIIRNWSQAPLVEIPLKSLPLVDRRKYALRSVLDYDRDITTFVFHADAPYLTIEMLPTSHTIAVPIGYDRPVTETTFPEFAAFILEPAPSC